MPEAHAEDYLSTQHSWLLRFFRSEFFNEWMAVYYLFKYPDSVGIQHYLCGEMKKFPLSVMEEFLPQLAHMLVTRPDLVALEAFIVDRCQYSSHFAILTLWYFQSYFEDLIDLVQSPSFKVCKRVIDQVQAIVTSKDAAESSGGEGGTSDPRHTMHSSLISLGCMLAAPGAPTLALTAGRLAVMHGMLSSSAAEGSIQGVDQMPNYIESITRSHPRAEYLRQEGSPSSLTSSDKASRASMNDLPGDSKDLCETIHRGSLDSSNLRSGSIISTTSRKRNSPIESLNASFRITSLSPSLEDLHRGKAFSFTRFVSKAATTTGRSMSSIVSKRKGATTSNMSMVSSSSSISQQPSKLVSNESIARDEMDRPPVSSGSPTSVDSLESMLDTDPKLLDRYYFHAEMQFINTIIEVSERLVAVPRESRQSTLTAELSLLNHNLPAPVCIPLWCPAVGNNTFHHQVVRISPADAVVLNSADRAPYLIFIEVLENECGFRMLKSESRQPLEKSLIKTSLHKSKLHMMPETERSSVDIQRLVDNETIANGLSIGSPDPAGTSTSVSTSPQSEQTGQHKRQSSLSVFTSMISATVSPPLPPPPLHSHPARLNPDISPPSITAIISHFTPDTHDDKYADQMRTAAIMLAQLAIQEQHQQSIPKTARSPPGRKKRKPYNNSTEEIRNRIIREMMALEEKRMQLLQESMPANPITASDDKKPISLALDIIAQNVSAEQLLLALPSSVALEQVSSVSNNDSGEINKGENGVVDKNNDNSNPSITPRSTVDKDDPSGAVFRETWTKKLSRIRQSSPYGSQANWRLLSVIVKSGADLRQEQLACQIVREMGRVWEEARAPCWVYNYRVLVTGGGCGLIETVRNSISIHSLKKEAYNRNQNVENFTYTLKDYFQSEFGDPGTERYKVAQKNFMHSLAAYSIISYILNLKDRHNGNILLDYTSGHLVHIDFGFMLSNSPGAVGFETAPFKLPLEYVEVLDGYGSDTFASWKSALVQGFLALRKSHERIVGLVEIMEKDSPLDCFRYTSLKGATATPVKAGTDSGNNTSTGKSQPTGTSSAPAQQAYPVSSALRDRFLLSLTDKQVDDFVEKLVTSSMGNVFTRLYDSFQYYTQGVMA